MVVVAQHLCKVSLDSGELSSVRAERDDLRENLLELEKENHAFEECYDPMSREKSSLEERVATLDGGVEHLSQGI